MWHSLGKVNCTVANTAYRITTNETDSTKRYACFALLFEQVPGNLDYFYVLDRDIALNTTTMAGVVAIIPKPTTDSLSKSTVLPFATVTVPQGSAPLNAADFYIASPAGSEGLLVSAVRL